MSWGNVETDKLRTNVEEQLNRLLQQLQDLEDLKDELDDDEIEDIKADTLEQMQEFETSLMRMMKGDVTLVDALGSVQLAIQAAIREGFRTPEVLRMFAKKDLGQLRGRLANIQVNVKLGKLTKDQGTTQAVEILTALKKLNDTLTPEEQNFLRENRMQIMSDFDKVQGDLGAGGKSKIMSAAASQIKRANV